MDTLVPEPRNGDNVYWHLDIAHHGDPGIRPAPDPDKSLPGMRHAGTMVSAGGKRPHRIAIGVYDHDLHDAARLILRDRIEVDLPADRNVAFSPGGTRPALVVLNDGDLTYAKIRFDADSLDTLRTRLSGLPDALTRAVVWNALRDAVRDGDLPAGDFLDIARTHLPRETDLALVQGVLAFASVHIADRYLTPGQRPTALATLTALCRDLIRRTEDGDNPGLRLVAVRQFIEVAAHPDTIAAWLADGTVPGGPELDPELRWRVLARLAALGATDETVIAAELERDPSATGRRAPPAAAPPSPTRTPRPAPGTPCSAPTTCPTTCSPPPPRASGSPNRPTSYAPTCPATTRRPWPSPPAAAPPSPTPPDAGPSPSTPSTPRPSSSARSACARPTPSRPCAASSPTSSTTCAAPCASSRRNTEHTARRGRNPFER
ncbi:hypothetical protein SHKM778_70340 [Streptomyces sp. KM77-8]|uniref:ERAP1-like C-terminal domain-containing protein n=1 Tax=Streptomyces haneummycinicus TaxID=3074435 RepID=A0AAT9HSR2_9ACTN